MSIYASDIFVLISNTFQIFVQLLCFDIFLQPRFSNVKHRIIQVMTTTFLIIMVHVTATGDNHVGFAIQLVAMFLSAAIYGKLVYRNKVFNFIQPSTVAISIIYNAYGVLLSGMAAGLAVIITGGDESIATMMDRPFDIPQAIIYILFGHVPVLAAYIMLKKRMKGQTLPHSSHFLYLVCASIVILAVVLFPVYAAFAHSEDLFGRIAFLSATFLLVVFPLIILGVIYQRGVLKLQQTQLDHICVKNELLSQHLNNLKYLHQERSKLAHDAKEHLSILYNLAKDEGNEKLCAYIEKIHSPLKDIVRIENTGSAFLDTILTVKKQQALKQGVVMDIDCDITPPLNIEPVDLTAILSNLLENALDACEKVKDIDERYIFVNIQSQGALLNIRIENSADDTLIRQNTKMQTTKENKELHGIGLKSVRSSVARYQGDIIFEQREGVFIVSIVLCLDL